MHEINEKYVSPPTTLTPAQLLAVHLEARGTLSYNEIAAQIGIAVVTLIKWRQKPAYIAKKQALLDEIDARLVQQTINHATRLDGLVPEAVRTVAELNSGVSSILVGDELVKVAIAPSTRLKAAEDIFDYSPNGPKRAAKGGDKAPVTVIQFGIGAMRNIQAALEDAGEQDVLTLIEGKDFEAQGVGVGQPSDASDPRFVPVEEV